MPEKLQNPQDAKKAGIKTKTENQVKLIETLRKLGVEKDRKMRLEQLQKYKESLQEKQKEPEKSQQLKEDKESQKRKISEGTPSNISRYSFPISLPLQIDPDALELIEKWDKKRKNNSDNPTSPLSSQENSEEGKEHKSKDRRPDFLQSVFGSDDETKAKGKKNDDNDHQNHSDINEKREKLSKAKNARRHGIKISKLSNEDKLKLELGYPTTPVAIQSPYTKNQGEINYQLRSSRAESKPLQQKENENAGQQNKVAAEIPNSDERINQLVDNLLSPGTGDDFELFSSELDNVSWVDFTEIAYLLKPEDQASADGLSEPELTEDEINALNELENNGVDSRDYEWFYREIKFAVHRGIWNVVLNKLRNYVVQPSDSILTPNYDASTIYFKAVYGNEEKEYTIDMNIITNGVMLELPWLYAADIADIYYSIAYPSSSDVFFARQGIFQNIESYFGVQYAAGPRMGDTYLYLAGVYELFGHQIQMDSWFYNAWSEVRDLLINLFGEGEEEISDLLDAYNYKPKPAQPYKFITFTPEKFNLGLRLVYRQEWRHLGNQRGEVIRTIPLGPKQVEKVSTKIVRRTKTSKTAEDLKSTETTTETTDTSKSSSEIVDEAAKSMKWNINQEVEGGYNVGIWHVEGTTSGGYERQSSESSRDTSTRLTETMQKVSNKVRTEAKVIVSTETEVTFEATTASEIQNPNEEIAITYVYSKFQNQYEVLTRLAEIQHIVMIAEEIPTPNEVNFDWVKKHDWIIAKVLLDDSYREALNSISQEQSPAEGLATSMIDELSRAKDSTIEALGAFANGTASATNIDMVVQSQESYRNALQARIERQIQRYQLEAKRDRLYIHIRDNILHYCRAIWQREDPQQRILRYRKLGIKVPVDWRYESPDMEIDPNADLSTLLEIDPYLAGSFVAESSGREVNLVDLINPAGPIGFYGNYAIYYMRPEYASDDISAMLQLLKTPYLYQDPETDEYILMDPRQKVLTEDNPPEDVPDEKIDSNRDDMIKFVPDLRLEYAKARRKVKNGTDLNAIDTFLNDYALFKKHYPEFLFRQEMSRRLVIDTNSLVIDIVPGEGSALEKFKQAHRGIDVLKAYEEKEQMRLEKERRGALLDNERFEDPDTERIVVVDNNSNGTGQAVAANAANRSTTSQL